MTYTPDIPEATDNISDSQSQIKVNFQQLNTIFDRNHYTWNNSTSANRGLHRQIDFPAPLVADPATSNNLLTVYSKADVNDDSARPQLYCQNVNGANNVRQITSRFIKAIANNGYLMLPNGTPDHPSIIMMWGFVTIPGSTTSGQVTVTLPSISNYVGSPAGFPNDIFNVQFSLKADSSADVPKTCIDTVAFSLQSFKIRFSSNAATTPTIVYWYAIGN